MLFENLAIPIRAQPFHVGHQKYIKRLSEECKDGVIFLCRDSDFNNPFSLSIRAKWINIFLHENKIHNITVAKRDDISVSRRCEYMSHFKDKEFVVITTDETNLIYKALGFKTFNHHDNCQKLFPEVLEKGNLSGLGTLIRKNLRQGIPCTDLLDKRVEKEAKKIIGSFP